MRESLHFGHIVFDLRRLKKNRSKSVKKTLTIPEWLNDEAEKQHVNFSGILQEALITKLNIN